MGEVGNGELLFKGYRDSVWEDEKVLEMDGGDGCLTMLMPLNCVHLEVVQILNFVIPQ